MSVWGDVFNGLNSMSLPQLLLAFIAGMTYMLAQGKLAPLRVRRIAAGTACCSAILFVVLGDGWERNTMLVVLAVGGIGGFICLAWLSAHLLGFGREPVAWSESAFAAEAGTVATTAANPTRSAALHSNGPTAVG